MRKRFDEIWLNFFMLSGPEDACQKRFSWFFYWIPKVQKRVNLVDLVKSFQTSIWNLLAKFGVDTAENEPLKVCRKLAKN